MGVGGGGGVGLGGGQGGCEWRSEAFVKSQKKNYFFWGGGGSGQGVGWGGGDELGTENGSFCENSGRGGGGGGGGGGVRLRGQGGCEWRSKVSVKIQNQSRTNGPINAHLTIPQV